LEFTLFANEIAALDRMDGPKSIVNPAPKGGREAMKHFVTRTTSCSTPPFDKVDGPVGDILLRGWR